MTPQLGTAQPVGGGLPVLADTPATREVARPGGDTPLPVGTDAQVAAPAAPPPEIGPSDRGAAEGAAEGGAVSLIQSRLAGPPPAFEASILDQMRSEANSPDLPPEPAELTDLVEALSAPDPLAPAKPTVEAAAEEVEEPVEPVLGGDSEAPARSEGESRYTVPPSAEVRAETEVATVRRIETPYDTATVDVSR